jgi:hypothetical protein
MSICYVDVDGLSRRKSALVSYVQIYFKYGFDFLYFSFFK